MQAARVSSGYTGRPARNAAPPIVCERVSIWWEKRAADRLEDDPGGGDDLGADAIAWKQHERAIHAGDDGSGRRQVPEAAWRTSTTSNANVERDVEAGSATLFGVRRSAIGVRGYTPWP